MKNLLKKVFIPVYANDIDAFIPEWWAQETLLILEEVMTIAGLVNTDFKNQLQSYGDVVNTRRPSEFVMKRKVNADNVTVQDANATNIPVPLDQHVHVSFTIKDGEESKSMVDLITTYIKPAALAIKRGIDRILLGQVYRFLVNSYGGLKQLTASNSIDFITGTGNKMDINKAYEDGRNLILTPNTRTLFQNNSAFTAAYSVGDGGTTMRTGKIGMKFGFDMEMCQNTPSIVAGNTVKAGTINSGSGYAVGTTVLTVDGFTGVTTVGAWITIAGDDSPQQVTATSATLGNTTSITIAPGLRKAVVDNAVITSYTAGAVNNGSNYAAGWSKEITIDSFTVAPQVGQMVTFGTTTTVYSIIDVNALVGITLDRPLLTGISDNDAVNIGPAGEYNFAFHRNALTLVIRPLAAPRAGTGALSAVIATENFAIRCTMQYQGLGQGTLVTLDALLGIAILDTNLGAVLLA